MQVSPLDSSHDSYPMQRYYARAYDEASQLIRTFMESNPDDPHPLRDLKFLYEATGRYQEAINAFGERLTLVGQVEEVAALSRAYEISGKDGYWRWMLDYEKERATRENVRPIFIARIYAQLGNEEQAFEWLEKAYEERDLVGIKVDPHLDPLRDDPRFQDLLRRMNLEP